MHGEACPFALGADLIVIALDRDNVGAAYVAAAHRRLHCGATVWERPSPKAVPAELVPGPVELIGARPDGGGEEPP